MHLRPRIRWTICSTYSLKKFPDSGYQRSYSSTSQPQIPYADSEAQSIPPASSSSSSSSSPPQTHLVPACNLMNPHVASNFRPPDQSKFNDIITSNKQINHYIRSGDLDSALRVFETMEFKTTITWNSILAGYSKSPGKLNETRQLFDKIPNPDTVSYNIILACYLQNYNIEKARLFFDSIPIKDIASWNTMITGFSQNGMMNEAQEFFSAMPVKNIVTWNAMISGYAESGDINYALDLFKLAPIKSVVAYTAIITGYMKFGKVEFAKKLFEEMPMKNLITWNAMISGYVENHQSEEGLKLFKTMVESRIKPNRSSLSSVLLGCSNLSSLKLGKQIHQLVYKSPLYFDPTTGTSLISMYFKCGDLGEAQKLFIETSRKDVVTWNAMISGYAQHGLGEKALTLFDEMRQKAIIKPDWITFVGVLLACNHRGLVDLGLHYFDKMQTQYGVKPRPDHYTCIIDLLGRAGKLSEALHLIQKMPFKPHAAVFGTLLGACRVHKNMELAEFAAKNLLNCDPTSAAGYVQLANVYAAMNKWENVSRVRKAMKNKNIIKTPGYSWIEIKGSVHKFRSGDRVHPELEFIHEKLKELEKKMKLKGYVPNLEFALHDVGEEQKGELLLWHSEKLAIAYGLTRTCLGEPIRVFKNLRVCGDCHLAIKFVSAVEEREIIVRDTTRFHHFKDGKCSCGDYW